MPINETPITPTNRLVLNKMMNDVEPKKEYKYFPYLQTYISI